MAIQLSKYRLRVNDPELKQGEAESYTQKGSGIKQPMAFPGGFAIVYKFRTRSGKPVALRVFQHKIVSDIKERYELLGSYLSQHAPDITTRFSFYETGIAVQDPTNQILREFPLITMDWVEGSTLIAKVDQLCQRGDSSSSKELKDLADRWRSLMEVLRKAKIAHGDLAAANVMVRPNGSLVLIDYDGMYIPPLKGRQAVVGGQPDYQHPEFSRGRGFDEKQDDFSWLVIFTALLALAEKSALWAQFTKRADDGKLLNDNLLFQEKDFLAPRDSDVFGELRKLTGKEVREALDELEAFCSRPIDKIELRREIWQSDWMEQQALVEFLKAIATDNDGVIESAWVPCLHAYPGVAATARQRAVAAVARMGYVRKLHGALAANRDRPIADAWKPWFDNHPMVSAAQRTRAKEAQKRWQAYLAFQEALKRRDEREIAKAEVPELWQYDGLTGEERILLEQAKRCVAMPTRVRAALAANDDDAISEAWDVSLHRPWTYFSPEETNRIEQAVRRVRTFPRLRTALASDEDGAIAKASEPWKTSQGTLSDPEWNRIQLACRRFDAVSTFRAGLATRDEREVVRAYDPILDGYGGLSADERKALDRARQCVEMPARVRLALSAGNDEDLEKVWNSDLRRPWSGFTDAEVGRIAGAIRRFHALPHLREALATDDDRAIARVWKPELESSTSLDPKERLRALLAMERIKALDGFMAAAETQDERSIVQAFRPVLDGYSHFSADNRDLLERARRCVAMPEAVRAALQANDDAEVSRLWDGGLLRQWSGFKPAEIERIGIVLRRMQALPQLKAALDADDDDKIVRAWKPWLQGSSGLTGEQQRRVNLALERGEALAAFRQAVVSRDERRIVEHYRPILDNYEGVTAEEHEILERARRCITMPERVRAALTIRDEAAVLREWDASQVRPWSSFAPTEVDEIRRILLSRTRH